ncbi:MAG: alpha/beta fold hydrolase [Patescibacteria group bacterium]|nr:alpha/beta fold hydrolase [Patescibacteria group bacterium]MDE2144369.1 alpha/beta fold hydrolase [Patescibacteria group bacterium]
MEKVWLQTKDNKKIAGLYYETDNPKGWVIYLHMMPAAKESWNKLAEELSKKGYTGIAIDFRGHGESDGGPDGYKDFSDSEHGAAINDIEAADKFLEKKGVKKGKGIVVGASIGANLALQYITSHLEYTIGVLLSPGINYHGVDTITAAEKMPPQDRLMFVSSEDDVGNTDQVKKITHSLPDGVYNKEIVYKTAGHGTNMFKTGEDPNLLEALVSFAESISPASSPEKLTEK